MKLTLEEMLYKFIDEGRREHEEMGAAQLSNYEVKGVTTREGKITTKIIRDTNEINKEPSTLHHEKPIEPDEVLVKTKPHEVKEQTIQPQTPLIPFPHRLKKEKEEAQQRKFLENLKQLHINIPFTEALSQMPKYAKFLKGLLSNKTRLRSKLCLGEPKPTRISLELADRSIQYPRGITENVLIKIDKFILPIDFVILDMREDSKILIILGRPFLATARAMIDVFNKKITLRVGNEEVIFDVDQSTKRPPAKEDECYGINFLGTTIHLKTQELLEDDQLDSFPVSNLEESIDVFKLESCDKTDETRTPIRRIRDVNTPYSQETKNEHLYSASANEIDEKRPVLKDIPTHLEYTYLKGDESRPVIISSELTKKRKIHFCRKGIEVDKAKIDVIAKLPYPSNVKGVRSFLGHAGFYRRFIKDFSMISKPMTQLLMKDTKFDFSEDLNMMPNQGLSDGFYFFKDSISKSKIKKGAENLAADHLSRLENPNIGELAEDEIADKFPDEHLMILKAKINDEKP
ncbi:reverse transcriptase domain-containing protein [Tanacetum coccineum]